MSSAAHTPFSRTPQIVALLMVCATFPLIWVGGLVTTHNAGMAVPDWPGTYGYNLLAYPLSTWWYGPWDLFIEHGHRLLGALAGMLAIAFVIAVFRYDGRRWMKLAALGALALVIAQGILGGMRVLLDARQMAMVHGCTGPVFFAYVCTLAVMTSQWWRRAQASTDKPPRGLVRAAAIATVLAYVQLVLGAQLRHLTTETPFAVLVTFHVLLAVGLVVQCFVVAAIALLHHPQQKMLTVPAVLLCCLLMVQVGLGASTWVVNYSFLGWEGFAPFSADYTIVAEGILQTNIVTAHVATGSLIIATGAVLTSAAGRILAVTGEMQQPDEPQYNEVKNSKSAMKHSSNKSRRNRGGHPTEGRPRRQRDLHDLQPIVSSIKASGINASGISTLTLGAFR